MTQRVTLPGSGHCCVCVGGLCHHAGGPRLCDDHRGPRPISTQWTECAEPGTATLMYSSTDDTITITVERADEVIAVSPPVLEALSQLGDHVHSDGTLVLDTAGEYRYQRVGERSIDGCTELIYRRIQR